MSQDDWKRRSVRYSEAEQQWVVELETGEVVMHRDKTALEQFLDELDLWDHVRERNLQR